MIDLDKIVAEAEAEAANEYFDRDKVCALLRRCAAALRDVTRERDQLGKEYDAISKLVDHGARSCCLWQSVEEALLDAHSHYNDF